ncbi:hypothetical protein RDI58_017659 [Solanum bulbocastanum]|uniref:Uncharacterized protein n=1 Tax=Solanum bulbocastanum TaxID=147425 RepID=A0AAN8T9X4_SOLBU
MLGREINLIVFLLIKTETTSSQSSQPAQPPNRAS